ncbi:MAG: DUF2382 domain-containing protein [Verrucomicrobiaceae bacterium]|nr:MAG: DUF2382 domain-containing protein [Verrucomicrobiaceae bacterium]
MTSSEQRLPLAEERISVAKRQVTTGRVRVRTETELIQENAALDLESDEVEIERVSIGQEVDEIPQVRTEDGVTIIPVLEEVLVIEKRLILKEELRLKRRVTTKHVEVPVTIRKQRAVVERLDFPRSDETTKDEAK